MSMSIEQKLSVDKFNVDEGHPHIVPDAGKMDMDLRVLLTKACPAGLYTLNDRNELVFESAGCLECGTCRVLCAGHKEALKWNYPEPSFGVSYRFG